MIWSLRNCHYKLPFINQPMYILSDGSTILISKHRLKFLHRPWNYTVFDNFIFNSVSLVIRLCIIYSRMYNLLPTFSTMAVKANCKSIVITIILNLTADCITSILNALLSTGKTFHVFRIVAGRFQCKIKSASGQGLYASPNALVLVVFFYPEPGSGQAGSAGGCSFSGQARDPDRSVTDSPGWKGNGFPSDHPGSATLFH